MKRRKFKWIWLFIKAGYEWPMMAFQEKTKGLAWIREKKLHGRLTAYPLDIGVYDWALYEDILKNEYCANDTAIFKSHYQCDSLESYNFPTYKLKNKIKLPVFWGKNEIISPSSEKCLVCGEVIENKMISLIGGAYFASPYNDENYSSIINAFSYLYWHGPRDMYCKTTLANLNRSNFELTTCSTKCMSIMVDYLLDSLDEDIQKIIKCPPEKWHIPYQIQIKFKKGYPRETLEEKKTIDKIWIFHGFKNNIPTGVFTSKENASFWIEQNSLRGRLLEFPINKEIKNSSSHIIKPANPNIFKFPYIKKESCNWEGLRICPVCKNSNHSGGIGVSAGAFFTKNKHIGGGGPSGKMVGFMDFFVQESETKYRIENIVIDAHSGQFEIIFCSTHCLRYFLNACIEFIKNKKRPKKNKLAPKTGIFWVIDGQVFDYAKPLNQVREVNCHKDVDMGHQTFWELERHGISAISNTEYDDFPRGRIIYDTKAKRFSIFMGKDMINKKAVIAGILKRFNLTEQKVIVREDEHYQLISPR